MSEERQAKPAPTAAEVTAARYWFSGADPLREPSMGPTTRVHVAVLLAALDAAEARAETAEKSLDIVRARWVEADRRANDNAERCENMRAEWVPWTKKLATAETERDEARAALKPGAIVVSDTEETVERVARALAVSDGYASDASRELVSTFLADARAVLAALKEAPRG